MSNPLLLRRRAMMFSGSRPDYLRITPISGACTITPKFIPVDIMNLEGYTPADKEYFFVPVALGYISYDDFMAIYNNNIEYSINAGSFQDAVLYEEIHLKNGDYIEFRRKPSAGVATTLTFPVRNKFNDNYYTVPPGHIMFCVDTQYIVSGNIMSLLDSNCTSKTISDCAFASLFSHETNLLSYNGIIEIDSFVNNPVDGTYCSDGEFLGMFLGCTNISSVPIFRTPMISNYDRFDSLFYDCGLIENYDMSTLGEGWNTFHNNISAKSLIIRDINPPVINGQTLPGLAADCNIYVPAGSVDAYKQAQYWSDRANYIFGLDENGEIPT